MEFVLKECRTGEAADLKTAASVEIAGGQLRLSFAAEEKTRNPKYAEDNMPLYEGDAVEIFLTLGERERYLEAEFNQNGAMFCAVIELRDGQKKSEMVDGRKHIDLTVCLTDGMWKTEAAIDIGWLKTLGFSEDCVYGNLLREDFDGECNMAIYAASPTYADTFHKTAAFVKLI